MTAFLSGQRHTDDLFRRRFHIVLLGRKEQLLKKFVPTLESFRKLNLTQRCQRLTQLVMRASMRRITSSGLPVAPHGS